MRTLNVNMTNGKIYQTAIDLLNSFNTNNEVYYPAAVNFSIQKNKAILSSLAEDIEKGRLGIIQHYAVSQEEDKFIIAPEHIETANKELADLLSMEQEVKLYVFRIDEIADVQLTPAQMNAIMCMIDEEIAE